MNTINNIISQLGGPTTVLFEVLGLIEIVLRSIPTKKNVSIIDNIVKVLNFIIKNRRKPSPDDKLAGDGTKNVVEIPRNKFI
jgi:hypothetical protein